MKLFKNIDEKIAEIGFAKVEENEYGCTYSRKNEEYDYTQEVHIGHKKSGKHILQSYDPDLHDGKNIGNTCVGLTGYEMSLFIKKMKQIGMYSGRKTTVGRNF